ncbi:hypothetical protein [Erwinia sp. E_sp_B04_7]|uniref:hypothetical protein n=1 Tax=unclassified Erwinia TaxID=2622719 RepID=UPI0030D1593D
MISAIFTLRMTHPVSDVLLADLKALLPSESLQFFCNELDEEWHYTLLCQQSDETCSLALSAIMVWHQLKKIVRIDYHNPCLHKDLTASPSTELFTLLKMPGAVLHLS